MKSRAALIVRIVDKEGLTLRELLARFAGGRGHYTTAGTPEQIAATSETFPIFFERIEEATAPDGYTMGHTSHLFLFDPEAGFADSWPHGTSAEEILADLEERI